MCKILLSIHPKFADKILNGEKKYEFRKVKAKQVPDKILIYSTSPISLVIGEAEIEDILIDTPNTIWKKTSDYSGIEESFFHDYFKNKEKAVAYQLTNVVKYKQPKTLKEFGINSAPQSFVYVQ